MLWSYRYISNEASESIHKFTQWQYKFAKKYYFEQAEWKDLKDDIFELFKTEYVISELNRRQYLNPRLKYRRRHQFWLEKLKEHAYEMALEVGRQILYHLDQWLKFHSGSGFAEEILGDDGFSTINDFGEIILGGNFQYNITEEFIETFLRNNPHFVQRFINDIDINEEFQEQTGETPSTWDQETQIEYVKDQIEDFGYAFIDLYDWLGQFGDAYTALLQAIKTYVYPAWRNWWSGLIEEAERHVSEAARRLYEALQNPSLGNLLATINLALHAQHVHGSMYEHMNLSSSDMDELSNLNTEELDDFVDTITGRDWKTASFKNDHIIKKISDDIQYQC